MLNSFIRCCSWKGLNVTSAERILPSMNSTFVSADNIFSGWWALLLTGRCISSANNVFDDLIKWADN